MSRLDLDILEVFSAVWFTSDNSIVAVVINFVTSLQFMKIFNLQELRQIIGLLSWKYQAVKESVEMEQTEKC